MSRYQPKYIANDEKTERPRKKPPWWLLAVLAALLAAGLGLYFTRGGPPGREASTPEPPPPVADATGTEQTEEYEPVPAQTQTIREHTIGPWQIELPENIQWTESTTQEGYQVDFYTYIEGNQLQLYTVFLGAPRDTAVGLYLLDGEEQSVSIRYHSLQSQMPLMDEGQLAVYNGAMDTAQNVTQAIMDSDRFLG